MKSYILVFIIIFIIFTLILFHQNTINKYIKRNHKYKIIENKIKNTILDIPIEKKVVIDLSDIKYYKNQQNTPQISIDTNIIDNNIIDNNIIDNNIIDTNIINNIANYDLTTDTNIIRYMQENTIEVIPEVNNQTIINNLINRPDSQNVHDSSVQNTIKNKYNIVTDVAYDNNNLINDICNYAYKTNTTKYKNISNIIKQINQRNSHIYNLNSNEMGILKNIWLSAPDIQKDQILNELIECIEDDKLVCPTGVATRIINSDVVINPEKSVKTSENLREEMMNTAIKLRNDLEESDIYKTSDEEVRSEMFKEELIKKYEQQYQTVIDMELVKNEYLKWINNL